MEIKGFILKPVKKKKTSVDALKYELEKIIGQYHISLATDRVKESVVMQNTFGKIELYNIKIKDFKDGQIVALICEPWYKKLIDPATSKPVIPKELTSYLKEIKECNIETKLYGAQG